MTRLMRSFVVEPSLIVVELLHHRLYIRARGRKKALISRSILGADEWVFRQYLSSRHMGVYRVRVSSQQRLA